MSTTRVPDYPISPIFIERWSPRAFDAQSMPEADLLTILEAARWAPSAYNIQPWRFIYSLRGDEHWQTHLGLLNEFNAGWAQNASALVFLISDKFMPERDGEVRPSPTHSFDAGAAWAQLALQTTQLGYQAHAMTGIHFDQIPAALNIPEQFQVEAAVAIGKQLDAATLPEVQVNREQPSQRRVLEEMVFVGSFLE